jgi:hypothetical protein
MIPKNIIFPISAIMLKNKEKYDKSLENFSLPLMELIKYDLDESGKMIVNNDTSNYYQYIDYTFQTETLYNFINETIEIELKQELDFLINYDKTKNSIQNIIDMPDNLIDLFIQLCLKNNYKLSIKKRTSHFNFLTDNELILMEKEVENGYHN